MSDFWDTCQQYIDRLNRDMTDVTRRYIMRRANLVSKAIYWSQVPSLDDWGKVESEAKQVKTVTRSNGTTVEVPDDASPTTSISRYPSRFWAWFSPDKELRLYEQVLMCNQSECDNCGGSVPNGHAGWCPFYGCGTPSNTPPGSGTVSSSNNDTVGPSDGETSVQAVPFDGCDCGTEWTWSNYTNRYWCKECGKYKPSDEETE